MALPEPSFFERDAQTIINEMVSDYENRVGRRLEPAQVERLLINGMAYRELLLRNQIQEASKQNLIAFAKYPMLDYLGELLGVTRLPATSAECTLQFTLINGHAGVTIPNGLRVGTSDGKAVFEIIQDVVVQAGNIVAVVQASCQTAGVSGNGYVASTIINILDPQPYLSSVSNTNTSAGGSDEETDEELRERIKLAPSSFSTAGSVGAYKFHAKGAHPSIVDVAVTSPTPGRVNIYPLVYGGDITPVNVLSAVANACSADKVRPLTDTVVVMSPTKVDYTINVALELYKDADVTSTEALVQSNLQEFVDGRKNLMGLDVVINQIVQKCMIDDLVYDVDVASPSEDIVINPNEFANCTGITVTVSGYNDDQSTGGGGSNLPPCEGGFVFESVSQVIGQEIIQAVFNSSGVYGLNWFVKSGGIILKQGFVVPASGLVSFSVAGLATGSYTVTIASTNCNGVGSLPINYSHPGNRIQAWRKREESAYCFVNGAGQYTGQKGWLLLEKYYIDNGDTVLPLQTKSNVNTDPDYVTPVTDTVTCPIGGSAITYANAFSGVAKETTTGTFSPHKFPNVSIPTEYNARIQNQLPHYIIMMNNDELGQFSSNGTTPFQKGIWSWRNNQFQPCVDFWDNCAGVTNEAFISPRSFNERYDLFLMNGFSYEGLDADTYFRTKTIAQSYAAGQTWGGPFGLGDSPDGFRTRRAVHESDVEIALVDGEELEPSKRLAAYYAGIADRSLGIVLAQYMCAFFTFGYAAEGRYPDPSGDYTSRTFPRGDGSGLTWSIPYYFWDQFQLAGQNKYITDYENLFLVEEISHVSEDSWNQDKLVYSPTGTYLRKVNHFGTTFDLTGETGYNVDHVLSRSISLIETDVYINKRMRNKESIQMFKIVCDRLGVGNGVWKWLDTQEYAQYGNRAVLALPREIAFMAIIMQYMSGSKGNLFWSSPQSDSPADGYNAIFGANVILNKPIQLGSESITLSSFRENLTFLQWNSEQSYDGGTTWVKHKAIDWYKSKNYLPLRIAYSENGHVVVFTCRPYGVEPNSCMWRVNINGAVHTGTITTNDWNSCYPVEEPNRKDYHITLIKI